MANDTGNGFGGLCANGHDVPVGAAYCPSCGAPAFPPTQGFGPLGGPPRSPAGGPQGPPPPGWSGPPPGQTGPPTQGFGPPTQGFGPPPGWNAPPPGRGPGYYPPPAWNAPPYGGVNAPAYYGPTASTNGLAIASMVLGILWFWWVGSILAVIFGHIAINQISRRGDRGHGMAVAGLVLGYLGIAILVIFITIGAIIR